MGTTPSRYHATLRNALPHLRRLVGKVVSVHGGHAPALSDVAVAYARFADKSGPMKSHISPHRNLFDWNDAQGRTQKDVVLMLQDFADEYRFRDI